MPKRSHPGWMILWSVMVGFAGAFVLASYFAGIGEPYDTLSEYFADCLTTTLTLTGYAAAFMAGLGLAVWAIVRRDIPITQTFFSRACALHAPVLPAAVVWSLVNMLAQLRNPGLDILEEKPAWILHHPAITYAASPAILAALVLYGLLSTLANLPENEPRPTRPLTSS